jgi:hypothetical protein
MDKAFFPDVKENFTRVPNIFFEEFLPCATANELKVMLFIIKKTLGWNKKWDMVSRSQYINEAGISNGSLSGTLKSCIAKGWLLKFEEGPKNKMQIYYFLNEGKNIAIVKGLRMNLFSIKDLAYMNEAGIIKLLKKHELLKNDEDDKFKSNKNSAYKNCTPKKVRPTEIVDPRGTKNVDRRPTETVDTKDNILKTIERMARQGIFFLPMIIVLPKLFGLNGVIYAQAAADLITNIFVLFLGLKIFNKLKINSKLKKIVDFN